MAFEHYIQNGARKLRCGYTTGTCAALVAAGAGTTLDWSGTGACQSGNAKRLAGRG